MKPFFSVVISVFNKKKYIKQTLNSVISQSFSSFEIIIIDDGSTDKSVEVIKSIEDQRINLVLTENHGASCARNTGIKLAKSDYIALLDGDDTWQNDYLQYMHDAIMKFPEKKIFTAGLAQKYQNKLVPVSYSFKQSELHGIHNYFESSGKFSLIHSSSVVFLKSILEKTKLFDSSIISGQDTDLWIRFGLHYDIVFINKQLVLYNYVPSSLSNTTFDLSKKAKFDKYFDKEKENKVLKAFLDKNRYSMALLSKIQNDKMHFSYFTSNLNTENLSLRQNILLKCPRWGLKLLLKLKYRIKKEKLYYTKA